MKKIYLSLAILAGIGLAGCNDSFLEHAPVTSLTENNAFRSYDNFKSFAWPCYEIFKDNNIANTINGTGQGSCYAGDMNAGYLESRANESGNDYAFGRVQSVASGNGWGFSGTFRRANILLANIDKSEMTDAEKDHWRAVGYFFHSYWYMELINRFGAVPWVNTALNENSPEAYGPRVDREIVADSVLNRLKWAEANIGDFEKQDGANTINRDCIRAAISRFALREATWRKYHGIDGAQKFFDECIRVSRLLMNDYPTLYYGTDGQPAAGYGEMWTTEDLGKVPGVILYMEFVQDIKMANFSALEHMDSHNVEMNQHTVDLYLCKDGKPIATSANYHGDKTPYATFRDRDPRLYHVVMPPYKVKAKVKTKEDPRTWDYTDDPADREYIDIMGPNESCDNPGIGMKRLPGQNWSASLVPSSPNFMGGIGATGFVRSRSGYYFWKNWSNWETNRNGGVTLNTSDKPIFKIEEVLLNYAEAMYELGTTGKALDDALNISLNLVRLRVNPDMPKLTTSFASENSLNMREEIRRERTIELYNEGFRVDDLKRWNTAIVEMPKPILGVKWTGTDFATSWAGASNMAKDSDGCLILENSRRWGSKNDLYPLPVDQCQLNPNLGQNPGWQ